MKDGGLEVCVILIGLVATGRAPSSHMTSNLELGYLHFVPLAQTYSRGKEGRHLFEP